MELAHDWRVFQSMFYPKRRGVAEPGRESHAPVYAVVDGDSIVTVYGEGEEHLRWAGHTYHEMAAELPHRELILFERKDVDDWMGTAVPLSHFYDQVESLRAQATPMIVTRSRFKKAGAPVALKPVKANELPIGRHFLLEGLQGWWSKLLPSAYGVFIRLDGNVRQDFFMVVRRGRVESFLEPDLGAIGIERAKQPKDVAKYLSEKYLVPVQSLTVPATEWAEWAQSAHPWRRVVYSLRSKTAKMIPFRWSLYFLAGLRALFGL